MQITKISGTNIAVALTMFRSLIFLGENLGRRSFSSQFFKQESFSQTGPEILLAGRSFLAGGYDVKLPNRLEYASEQDLIMYRMIQKPRSMDELSKDLSKVLDDNLDVKGAILIKGLSKIIHSNSDFSHLADNLGEKFAYTAGFATREEFKDAPGNHLATLENKCYTFSLRRTFYLTV